MNDSLDDWFDEEPTDPLDISETNKEPVLDLIPCGWEENKEELNDIVKASIDELLETLAKDQIYPSINEENEKRFGSECLVFEKSHEKLIASFIMDDGDMDEIYCTIYDKNQFQPWISFWSIGALKTYIYYFYSHN